jgi:hypothetical protein
MRARNPEDHHRQVVTATITLAQYEAKKVVKARLQARRQGQGQPCVGRAAIKARQRIFASTSRRAIPEGASAGAGTVPIGAWARLGPVA